MPSSEYFEGLFATNTEFWRRFGERPSVEGKRVLDVGSGHGNMAFELAEQGATVVGADPDVASYEFALAMLDERYGHLRDRITFTLDDVESITDQQFDLILSKDTFEHVADMEGMCRQLARLLAPGGQIWAGFAPLYYSPYGHHGRTGTTRPWGHVFRRTGDLGAVGLNGMTPAEFRRFVQNAGLRMRSVLYNRGDKRLLRPLRWFRSVPGAEKYATVSIYAVLEHDEAAIAAAA